jgi:hypothetical protein
MSATRANVNCIRAAARLTAPGVTAVREMETTNQKSTARRRRPT